MTLFTLKNDALEVVISTFGATVVSIKVPDKNGNPVDVVLGYDDIKKYERQTKYIGATVGRCCNRIAGGKIWINDEFYQLNCNDNENHLHGGIVGFDKREWQAREIPDCVELFYQSPDGEENYPANLDVTVTYRLVDSALEINYKAHSDSDTVCNLTNHSYFNLKGCGDILNHYVQIFADKFTENDAQSLPTGKFIDVTSTPMDFRTPKQIGQDIENDYYQIRYAKGFDNNWVINNFDGNIRKAARAYSEDSGITLEVFTNLVGIQFYSGNFLDGAENGKNNIPIKSRDAFCLECQYFPNAFANKNFPQPVLKAGEVYDKTIIYKFS